jgi:phage protein U
MLTGIQLSTTASAVILASSRITTREMDQFSGAGHEHLIHLVGRLRPNIAGTLCGIGSSIEKYVLV